MEQRTCPRCKGEIEASRPKSKWCRKCDTKGLSHKTAIETLGQVVAELQERVAKLEERCRAD